MSARVLAVGAAAVAGLALALSRAPAPVAVGDARLAGSRQMDGLGPLGGALTRSVSVPAPIRAERFAPPRDARAELVQAIRADLASPSGPVRYVAVVWARQHDASELDPEVRALAVADPDVAVRRAAVARLALGDAAASRIVLERAARDPDPVVQSNAVLGLARAGDEARRLQLRRALAAAEKDGDAAVSSVLAYELDRLR